MDPYVEACAGLEAAGVRYLIVGAFGASLYAGQADILRSKEAAGRPKDRLFLETYREALAEMMRRA